MSDTGSYPARRLPKGQRKNPLAEVLEERRRSEWARREAEQIPIAKPRKCRIAFCDGPIERAPELIRLDMCRECIEATANAFGAYRARVAQQREAERAATRPAREQPPGSIYYLQVGEHIKIGWSRELEQRMRDYPPNTLLLAVHPGTESEETRLHKRLAVHRSHGREWYHPAPVVLDHVDSMKRKYGEPPAVQFAAAAVTTPTPRQREVTQLRRRSRRFG